MIIVRLFHSPEHVYRGHHGRPSGTTPMTEVSAARLHSGRGIEGDRYAADEGARGQVTFFAEETWLRLCRDLSVDRDPGVFRRNIVVRGEDLNALIGAEFEVQGLRFRGVEYCKPCYWMDEAFAPGTLERLSEWRAGGLRAAVLSDGVLSAEPVMAARCSE